MCLGVEVSPRETLLDLPGPVLETVASFLSPAARKIFRLTCKEARQLVDRTVQHVTVDFSNVRVLCGPWRRLHTTFPQLRHLTVSLRSAGAVTWDVQQHPATAAAAAEATAGCSRRAPDAPAAAAASYSLRILRDSVPKLKHLRSIDLTGCYLDPQVWSALCSAGGGGSGGSGLPPGLLLRLYPAAMLLFPGRTWAERLAFMLGQLAAAQPAVRVRVVCCGGSGVGSGGGRGGGWGGDAACWCDVDGEAGLRKLAELSYIYELPVCVWSRVPCQPTWLSPLSRLTRLRRLHISCHNGTDPWDHAWLGGLSAMTALRELNLGRTESPLSLADLALLSACTALTALSVGTLSAAAAPPLQLAFGGGGVGAAAPLPLPQQQQQQRLGGGGAAAAATITPLPQIRRLEVRRCLSAGPLPLGELVPGAVSISMCAMSIGGGGGGIRRGDGGERQGSRAVPGHVLESLLTAQSAPPGGQLQGLPLPPPRPPLPHLRYGLRSLELVQQETAVIALGPAVQSTGRSPLPDTALLRELTALEHLQFTAWRLPGSQLPALLAAAQQLPRLRRLTFRDCDVQFFGWGWGWRWGPGSSTYTTYHPRGLLGLGLGLARGVHLRSLECLEMLGAPSLGLLDQLVLVCRTPQLRQLELYGVHHWDERTFQRILGTATRATCGAAAAAFATAVTPAASSAVSVTRYGSDGGGDGDDGGMSRLLVTFRATAGYVAAAAVAAARGCMRDPEHSGVHKASGVGPSPRHPSTAVPEVAVAAAAAAAAVGAAVKPVSCSSVIRTATAAEHEFDKPRRPTGHLRVAVAVAAAESGSRNPAGALRRDDGGGGDDDKKCTSSSRSGSRRWPRLSYIAVHDCPGTRLEDLRRQTLVAGLGSSVVDWMAVSTGGCGGGEEEGEEDNRE